MKARLVVVSGGAPFSDIEVKLPVILGRSRRAGLLVPHSSVSRQHCELYESDAKLMLRDLGSMNGTLVNQLRIEEPVVLRPGDSVTVGPVTFRAEYSDSYATQSDAKDETAVAKKSDLDQLLRIPAEPPPPVPDEPSDALLRNLQ